MDEILVLSILVNLLKKAIYFFGEIGLLEKKLGLSRAGPMIKRFISLTKFLPRCHQTFIACAFTFLWT